jgi:hypothetical protein
MPIVWSSDILKVVGLIKWLEYYIKKTANAALYLEYQKTITEILKQQAYVMFTLETISNCTYVLDKKRFKHS